MGCGCRGKGGTQGGVVASEVLGYDYISPDGVSYQQTNGGALLFSLAEARAEQRANGGGTIRTVRRSD